MSLTDRAAPCPVPAADIRRAVLRVIRVAPRTYLRLPPREEEQEDGKGGRADEAEKERLQAEGPENENTGEGEDGEREKERQARDIQRLIDASGSQPWWLQMPQR